MNGVLQLDLLFFSGSLEEATKKENFYFVMIYFVEFCLKLRSNLPG